MLFEDGIHDWRCLVPFLPIWMDGGESNANDITVTANQAVLFPFWVPSRFTCAKIYIYIDTSAGNIDLGIYDKNGNRVVSTGSTASPGTGKRAFNLSATLVPRLNPYYVAYAGSSGSLALQGVQGNGVDYGFRPLFYNTSFPLPSSLNLGSPSSRGTASLRLAYILENSLGPAAA